MTIWRKNLTKFFYFFSDSCTPIPLSSGSALIVRDNRFRYYKWHNPINTAGCTENSMTTKHETTFSQLFWLWSCQIFVRFQANFNSFKDWKKQPFKQKIMLWFNTKTTVFQGVFEKELTHVGGFQLLDLIIPELKSHVIPYKFKCSHWWKIHL